MSPATGGSQGGTLVSLSGTDFGAGPVTVSVGPFPVQFVVHVSATTVQFYTPPGSGVGLVVTVSTAHQQSAAAPAALFSYVLHMLHAPGRCVHARRSGCDVATGC